MFSYSKNLHLEINFVKINVFPASLKPTNRTLVFALRFKKNRIVMRTTMKAKATDPTIIHVSKPAD